MHYFSSGFNFVTYIVNYLSRKWQSIKLYKLNQKHLTCLIRSNEDEDEGFLISDTGIGMRMKAMEYWKCSETGLTSGNSKESIRFVLVESLKGQGKTNDKTRPSNPFYMYQSSDLNNTCIACITCNIIFVHVLSRFIIYTVANWEKIVPLCHLFICYIPKFFTSLY